MSTVQYAFNMWAMIALHLEEKHSGKEVHILLWLMQADNLIWHD